VISRPNRTTRGASSMMPVSRPPRETWDMVAGGVAFRLVTLPATSGWTGTDDADERSLKSGKRGGGGWSDFRTGAVIDHARVQVDEAVAQQGAAPFQLLHETQPHPRSVPGRCARSAQARGLRRNRRSCAR
jgi:hypothetical protein